MTNRWANVVLMDSWNLTTQFYQLTLALIKDTASCINGNFQRSCNFERTNLWKSKSLLVDGSFFGARAMTKQSILQSVGFDMSPVDSSTRVRHSTFSSSSVNLSGLWGLMCCCVFKLTQAISKKNKEHKRACFLCANSRMLCWAEFLFLHGIEMMIEWKAQGFLFGSSKLTSGLGSSPPTYLHFQKEEEKCNTENLPKSE